MGSGGFGIFDPIGSFTQASMKDYDYRAAMMDEIPEVTSATGAILPQAEQAQFSEGEEATVRKNITKKRLGTKQLRIPLADTGVESNPDV